MKSEKLYDSERYAVLAAVYAKEGTEVSGESVGAYRTKMVRAGDYLYLSCYPLITSGARKDQEETMKRMRADRKAQARYAKYNNARRTRDFEMLVNANFGKGSFHVSMTYALQNLDVHADVEYRTREDARREARNYIRRVKRLLRRHGCNLDEFRWITCTVSRTRNQECQRPLPDSHHHHVLMAGVPEELRGELERMWEFGYCNADRLQPRDKGVADMAGYIARQEGSANGERPGKKSYSTSKNIIRPRITTSDVKLSRRRVGQIAADVRRDGIDILEKIYPEYRAAEPPKVELSDYVTGAYIYAVMRRREKGHSEKREIKKGRGYDAKSNAMVRKTRH